MARPVIWKWEVPVLGAAGSEGAELVMPAGAEVLDVQLQNEVPVLWAVCDPERPMERRRFYLVGTGLELPEGWLEHRGTFQLDGFVGHVFEAVNVARGD